MLSGAVTPGQLTCNLAAVDATLSAGDLSELEAHVEPPERYWATRSSLAWT